MNDAFHTIWWEDGAVCLIDQRLLPAQEVVVRCESLDAVVRAIETMQVRGAPAIGCTAAYGMALIAQQSVKPSSSYRDATDMLDRLEQAKQRLDAARPTAVNLAWATDRVLQVVRRVVDDN